MAKSRTSKASNSKREQSSDTALYSVWGEYTPKLKTLLRMGYSFGTYNGSSGVVGFYYHNGVYNKFPENFRTADDAIRIMADYFLKEKKI